MGSTIVVFMAIAAIFMGIYYIGSEYQIAIGFCAIALGIIILIALETGKFDEYIKEQPQNSAKHIGTEVIHDTINHIFIQEVHDTVYLAMKPAKEMLEDSIEVEIISNIPLTENEVDSLADAVIYNH